MFNKSFLASLVLGVAALAGSSSSASAQYAPPQAGQFTYGCATPGQLMASNVDFDRRMDQYAWQMSQQIARNMKPGEQLPFNAMTISKSISEGNQAFQGYIGSVQRNSNIQMAAVNRYCVGAIQGNWYYGQGGSAPVYILPYRQNTYNVQGGYAYPGYVQGGYNIYPVYPR